MSETESLPAALAALDRWPGGSASRSDGDGPSDVEAVPRFDAGSVLAGQELSWLELLERARALGPDEALTGLDDDALVAELGAQASRVAAATCRYLQLVAELVVRGVWGVGRSRGQDAGAVVVVRGGGGGVDGGRSRPGGVAAA